MIEATCKIESRALICPAFLLNATSKRYRVNRFLLAALLLLPSPKKKRCQEEKVSTFRFSLRSMLLVMAVFAFALAQTSYLMVSRWTFRHKTIAVLEADLPRLVHDLDEMRQQRAWTEVADDALPAVFADARKGFDVAHQHLLNYRGSLRDGSPFMISVSYLGAFSPNPAETLVLWRLLGPKRHGSHGGMGCGTNRRIRKRRLNACWRLRSVTSRSPSSLRRSRTERRS